ncbi:MAG: hypothetical protein KJ749_13070, partial [Planctomycetes bacterium]|nr:hypothetical protein [Planctomycetota bacterium]
ANVRASVTQEMVFVIATAVNRAHQAWSNDSVFLDGLKLDFFYLGSASGYRYRKVIPKLVDEPILRVNPTLAAILEAAPVRLKLDMAALRALPNHDVALTELSPRDGEALPCIKLTHQALGYTAYIALGGKPKSPPKAFVDTGGEVLHFAPKFLNGSWTPLIWFTQIALEIEEEMAARNQETATSPDRATNVRVSDPRGEGPTGPAVRIRSDERPGV